MYEYDSQLNNKKEETTYGSNIYAVVEDADGVQCYYSSTKLLIVGNSVNTNNPTDSSTFGSNQEYSL